MSMGSFLIGLMSNEPGLTGAMRCQLKQVQERCTLLGGLKRPYTLVVYYLDLKATAAISIEYDLS